MEKIEQLFKAEARGILDTPKKENRSQKEIPSTIIAELNSGKFTSEMLEDLAAQFPIFRYKTQVTIHGMWPQIEISRIGTYKNLVRNGNGSLGVRYSAIDCAKRQSIARDLHSCDSPFAYRENSTAHGYEINVSINNEADRTTHLPIFKTIAERVRQAEFWGSVEINLYRIPWGSLIMRLEVQVDAIREGKMQELSAALLGESIEVIRQRREALDAADAKKEKESNAEFIELMRLRDIRRAAAKEAHAALEAALKGMPATDTLASGLLIAAVEDTTGSAHYHVVRALEKKAFGKMAYEYAKTTTLPKTQADLDALDWTKAAKSINPATITPSYAKIPYHVLSIDAPVKPLSTPTSAVNKAVLTAQTGSIPMEIKVHLHTRRNTNVYVVTLGERITREKFDELHTKARSYGGWYSKAYQGSPAGFMFTKEEKATTFVKASN